MSDHGDLSGALARFSGMVNPSTTLVGMFTCPTPVNAGQMGYTLSAALYQLARWARTGGVSKGIPAAAPPLFADQSVGEGPNTAPVRDANVNIVGGVRSPAVDVPVATLTGQIDPSATGFCALSGTTTPFTSAELHAHYPTHAEFVSKWRASVDQLVRQGYLLPEDGGLLIQAAEFNGGLW
jgi:hypothetical protein